jgi:hypothetical protein
MKFTIEKCVFIVKTSAREKLTENISVNFIINILTLVPTKSCVCKLLKKWHVASAVCDTKKRSNRNGLTEGKVLDTEA